MGADLYIKNMDREKQYTGYRTDITVGYFRDCYNDSGLFSKLNLSWWTITGEYEKLGLIKNGELTVEGCKKLLSFLSFHRLTVRLNKEYNNWFKKLIAMLKKAIKLNSPIIWSV